jgi:hypothetical protein
MLIGPTYPSPRPSWGPRESRQQGYRDPRKVAPTTRAALEWRVLAMKGSRGKSCERGSYQRRIEELMCAGEPRAVKAESELVKVGRRTTGRFR